MKTNREREMVSLSRTHFCHQVMLSHCSPSELLCCWAPSSFITSAWFVLDTFLVFYSHPLFFYHGCTYKMASARGPKRDCNDKPNSAVILELQYNHFYILTWQTFDHMSEGFYLQRKAFLAGANKYVSERALCALCWLFLGHSLQLHVQF